LIEHRLSHHLLDSSATVIASKCACTTDIETPSKFYGFDRPYHRDTRRPGKIENCPADDSSACANERSSYSSMIGSNGVACVALTDGVVAMKTIISALIALSVLASVAGPTSALDAKQFYEQQERQSH
jgi:hypothetical protein